MADADVPSVVLVTWNLEGRAGVDVAAVAAVLAERGADVAALQEVPRRALRGLADARGAPGHWTFKHWALVAPPEGLGLVGAVRSPAALRLSRGAPPWSWRRRVAQVVHVTGLGVVVNAHLASGGSARARCAQVDRLLRGARPDVVVGDLNEAPGGPALQRFAAAGLRDAWAEVGASGTGATNWPAGPRDAPPTQRLDYVLVGPDVEVEAAQLPTAADAVTRCARLSDHLPLAVTVRRRAGRRPPPAAP